MTAVATDNAVAAAVHVHDALRSRDHVQHVNVLRDDAGDFSALFQVRECIMPRIRRRLKRVLPTDVVTRPVVSAIVLIGHILLNRHRVASRRPRRSIIRQSRIRRNSSSRDDSKFLIFQEGDDGFKCLNKIFRFRAGSVRGRRLNVLNLQVRRVATGEIVINRVRHGSIIGAVSRGRLGRFCHTESIPDSTFDQIGVAFEH